MYVTERPQNAAGGKASTPGPSPLRAGPILVSFIDRVKHRVAIKAMMNKARGATLRPRLLRHVGRFILPIGLGGACFGKGACRDSPSRPPRRRAWPGGTGKRQPPACTWLCVTWRGELWPRSSTCSSSGASSTSSAHLRLSSYAGLLVYIRDMLAAFCT